MTLEQVKTFVVGTLRGWFQNKTVLDKLADDHGTLIYGGKAVGGSDVTNAEIAQAISATITELNQYAEEPEEPTPVEPQLLQFTIDAYAAPTPTEADGVTNNNMISTVTVVDGNIISITADVANLISFASSEPSQGTHKWLAIGVDTGIIPLTNVYYGDYQFTQSDINDASATGCTESSFVIYIKADEVINTPKTFTLKSNGYADKEVTITVAQS